MADCNTCVHHKQALPFAYPCDECLLGEGLIHYKPDPAFINLVPVAEPKKSALQVQVGGDHYKVLKIQPVEFCIANKMDFFQKDIIKYVSRRKGDKAKRLEDLRKARHYLDMYIEAIEQGNWE